MIEPLKVIDKFYALAASDNRVTAIHVSMYMVLVHLMTLQKITPIVVTRKQIMWLTKIKGLATFQKCIRDLQEFGLIAYRPSYDPSGKTLIYFTEKP